MKSLGKIRFVGESSSFFWVLFVCFLKTTETCSLHDALPAPGSAHTQISKHICGLLSPCVVWLLFLVEDFSI